jgi:hypothetical protein
VPGSALESLERIKRRETTQHNVTS